MSLGMKHQRQPKSLEISRKRVNEFFTSEHSQYPQAPSPRLSVTRSHRLPTYLGPRPCLYLCRGWFKVFRSELTEQPQVKGAYRGPMVVVRTALSPHPSHSFQTAPWSSGGLRHLTVLCQGPGSAGPRKPQTKSLKTCKMNEMRPFLFFSPTTLLWHLLRFMGDREG